MYFYHTKQHDLVEMIRRINGPFSCFILTKQSEKYGIPVDKVAIIGLFVSVCG